MANISNTATNSCEPWFEDLTWPQIVIASTITTADYMLGVWIVCINLLVLTVLVNTRKKWTPLDLHLMSITFSDLLQGILFVPMDNLVAVIDVKHKWCFAIYFICYGLFCVQPYSFLASTIDRYWAIVYPFSYRAKMTLKLTASK